MNLAPGVLVIFIIAIPGIVFRLTYLSSPYSRRTINTTAIDEIFNSLIPAFIFHALFILILEFCGKKIDFQFIYNLLIGNSTAKNVDELNSYLGGFLCYILLNTLVNFGAAWLLRYWVLRYKWYERFTFLTIYNRWYPILKPEATENGKISVWLDVLLETRDGSILYRGFLTDFWLDKSGGIKELHFENVRRRAFKQDIEEIKIDTEATGDEPTEQGIQDVDKRYYYIPGERFIIKYEDVRNMNVTYYEEELVDA